MSVTSSLRALALASALAVPSFASFAYAAAPAPFSLSENASPVASEERSSSSADTTALGLESAQPQKAQFLADAPPTEQPNIHGFVEVPFKTAYVTPRGLVVENRAWSSSPSPASSSRSATSARSRASRS